MSRDDHSERPHRETAPDSALERRNRFMGLALAGLVVFLFVVTYFRIKGLTP